MVRVASIALVAGAATLGDFIWYSAGVRHTLTAGILHGVILLTVVGGVLGASSGRLAKGLPIGALAGLGGALSYYLFVAVIDSRTYGSAIPAAWVVMWRAPHRRPWSAVAVRGLVAAAAAGFAFALVRNILWGRPVGVDRNYVLQFAAWAAAWAPGLLALTWGRTGGPVSATAGGSPRTAAASTAPVSPATKDATSISAVELLAAIDRGEAPQVLDVRSESEYAAGHVPGAINIPFNQVPFRLPEVPGSADETLVLYCGHGPRAYIAGSALRQGGRLRLVYLTGHFAVWEREGLRIERHAQPGGR
jgi:rhodanese-related sulfurtransferase